MHMDLYLHCCLCLHGMHRNKFTTLGHFEFYASHVLDFVGL